MSFKTPNSIIVDNSSFFIGTTGFNATTTPSNENKITSSDGATDDRFGTSVAIGSGRIVVGAIFDGDNGFNSGSAYIFDLDGTQLAKITASDGTSNDLFGTSVAIGSGRIVVGAYGDESNRGSVYIFDLNGTQLAKITASDGAATDLFGRSVAIGSGRIVVGAFSDDVGANISQGSVYIFDLDGTQLAKITASDGAANDYFGTSVAVGCGRIVVGAPEADPLTTLQGLAYIFDLDGNELAKINSSAITAGERFGTSVAVGCGRIVVGADGSSNLNLTGAAYIFDLNGTQSTRITASDGVVTDQFGISVAIGSGRIVVGAHLDDVGANSNQGSVYIFDLDGTQLAKITASDGAASDGFGEALAIGSGRIVVGSRLDDVGANSSQGSAYIYNTPYQQHYLDQLDQR